MKIFVHGTLAAAVVVALSGTAQADTFQFTEIEPPENLRNLIPAAINNSGQVAAVGRFPKDIDIRLEWITPEMRSQAGIPQDTEEEVVESITEAQYNRLIPLLEDRFNSNLRNQRIGTNRAVTYNGTTEVYQFFNDTDPATPELENAVESSLYQVNENGVYVGYGSAPYRPLVHTYTTEIDGEETEIEQTFFERDFISRGVWLWDGQIKTVEPPEQEALGGESAILDINENNLAVGYASVGISPSAQEDIDNCTGETDAVETRPDFACVWNLWYLRQSSSITYLRSSQFDRTQITGNNSIYDVHAFMWQLDANGDVISATDLGTLGERNEEEDDLDYSSYAYAVNNNGIAVGQSWTYYNGNTNIRVKMPVYFQDGEAFPITLDERYRWGAAVDINDNGLVVGYVKRLVNDTLRDVPFTYDLSVSEPELVELDSFFIGSAAVVTAVNNSGVIVGSAEVEATISGNRRRAGFMMDTTADNMEMINLNDTISCDTDYFIVSAEDINDNGQVVATALVNVSYTDDNGNRQIRTDTKTLKLDPTGGELNDCRQEQEQVERSGAATGLFSVLGMLLIGGLITIRQRFFK